VRVGFDDESTNAVTPSAAPVSTPAFVLSIPTQPDFGFPTWSAPASSTCTIN
jgi:hypothetical protein